MLVRSGTEKPAMYVSCSSCVEAHRPLPEALRRIAELGFRAVDLLIIAGMKHLHPQDLLQADRRQQVAAAITEAGLTVSSFNCGFSVPFSDDAAARVQREREFVAMLSLADEVGCPLLNFQLGGMREGETREGARERLGAGLHELTAWKGDRDLRLTFEPHYGSPAEEPAQALALVERVWPEVGIAYDPSHFAMHPAVASLAESEPLLDYAQHVHVRNAAPGRMQAPMEEGTVDFAWLVAALRKRGYAGALAIEYLDGEEAEAVKLRDVLVGLGVPL
jgi:sugar phosphate isomerase/epimerase